MTVSQNNQLVVSGAPTACSDTRIHTDVRSVHSCQNFVLAVLAAALLSGCSSPPKLGEREPFGGRVNLVAVEIRDPVELKLKGTPQTRDQVDYHHVSASRAFEAGELRQEKTDAVSFTAETATVKADAGRITQVVQIAKKDGTLDLHDFAMPELGESLEIVATEKGKILKAGDWPSNSIFFVPPVSLPDGPVAVGDTWTMQAAWLSLGELVPYELDMLSILKGFVRCGDGTCADIELSGAVGMQGELKKALVFRSEWRGRLLFSLDAGSVVWSRVDSEETLASDKVHRTVKSCLESVLREPVNRAVQIGSDAVVSCSGFSAPTSAVNL